MKPKILVTRKITDEAENNLAENFDVTFNKNDEPIPYEKLIDLANQYDGLVVSGWDKFDENFFNKMKGKLKIIATFSVGYDHININSAKEKNIVITIGAYKAATINPVSKAIRYFVKLIFRFEILSQFVSKLTGAEFASNAVLP